MFALYSFRHELHAVVDFEKPLVCTITPALPNITKPPLGAVTYIYDIIHIHKPIHI